MSWVVTAGLKGIFFLSEAVLGGEDRYFIRLTKGDEVVGEIRYNEKDRPLEIRYGKTRLALKNQ